MKIYTKKGDTGTTMNIMGEELSKGDLLLEAQGSVDEVNAHIGYLKTMIAAKEIIMELTDIQRQLIDVGVEISARFTQGRITEEHVKKVECKIDQMTEKMSPLVSFIIYSGTPDAAYAQIVRGVVRRAERDLVRTLGEMPSSISLLYINRLSDYFFTLSRYLNHIQGMEENVK